MFKLVFSRSSLLGLLLLCLSSIASAEAAPQNTRRVLVFGDSLSAGFGIAIKDSWPALLAERLKTHAPKNRPILVTNASISGETTAGGRSRLDAALAQFSPDLVILALGANDGLRGLPIASMRENLEAMIKAAKKRGARVLLVGMRLPPNYGTDYTSRFEASFKDLARSERTGFVPFLLEPIAADRSQFLPDGLHPTAAAQPAILDHIWPGLKPLLR